MTVDHQSPYVPHSPLATRHSPPTPNPGPVGGPSDAGERRFRDPAPGAVSTRATFIDVHDRTLGDWRIPHASPPVYVQDGPLVFALQRCAPHPTEPETLAVYREIFLYKLSAAQPVSGGGGR